MISAAAYSNEGSIAAADEMHAVCGCGAWQRIRSAEGGLSRGHLFLRSLTGCPAAMRRRWTRGFKALLKVKQWSQTVAAQRWRPFIRRIRIRRGVNRMRSARFGYDPLSYARNFDEGQARDDSDGDTARRGFSARYATATPSRKASMDLFAAPPFVGDDY